MKKIISLITVTAIVMALCIPAPAMAQTAFSDIDSTHWAMSSVEKLVSLGTINGFEDGTFRPNGIVSRAQFVKMLGKSDIKFEVPFADVPENHWAYEYIMYSCLDGDQNGMFRPDEPITRGDVASLLYKRFANGAKTKAPLYIASQGENTTAVSWVYNTGLMIGSDMLNLRLDDTLTRAEAAVLIVRAQELKLDVKKNFIDNFTDEQYKLIYEASALFDTPYEADGNITGEELATAAMRFQCKSRIPILKYYTFEELYKSDYAKYWSSAVNYALDEKNIKATYEEATKPATVAEAVSILTLGARNNEFTDSSNIEINGQYHPGVTVINNESHYASNMSFAYNFGLSLYADGKINPDKLITKKEVSCIILQYGLSYGFYMGYSCGYDANYLPATIRLNKAAYPANSNLYTAVFEEIPSAVYNTPYPGEFSRTPAQMYAMTSMIPNTFTTPLMYIAAESYEKGSEIYIDFFPTLVAGYMEAGDILRVRLTVKNAFDGMKLSDLLPLEAGVEDVSLVSGDSMWIDINTKQYSAVTLYLDYELMTIAGVIR